MIRRIAEFQEIWFVDFEFYQPDGEVPTPLCMVAKEMSNGRVVRMWRGDLLRQTQAPFRTDAQALMVAYYASAELGCFLALGWPMPTNVLDLYAEFSLITSGLPRPCGRGLLGACAQYGISAGSSESHKDEMRGLAQRGREFTEQEQEELLTYCTTDVDALALLLPAMRSDIEDPPSMSPNDRHKALGQAQQRGDYVKAVATMERRGVPINTRALTKLLDNWGQVERALIAKVDNAFHVYDGDHFLTAAFDRYLIEQKISWPRTPAGRPKLDKDTFKEFSLTYPQLAPLHELRATLAQLKEWKLAVGSDGRNRCLLSPFGAKTGRNTPSASAFVFALATWLRGLVRPQKGWAIAYLDFEQQEFGIAAFLSGDKNMMAAYLSGDAYLEFGKQIGLIPPDGTKESHGAIRDQLKTCILGIQYGMGAELLAQRIGESLSRARELLRLHRETYPDYWRWSEACVNFAMLHGHLTATFGWRINVGPDTRPTTLRNFLLQANGAEMLRLACILATERRLPVCCPIHDALLIEDDTKVIDVTVEKVRQVMIEASKQVLPGFPLRVEAKVTRWPERFRDKRGEKMWKTVWELIENLGQG
jgi:hypothetical protein